MCGIAGFLSPGLGARDFMSARVRDMARAMAHRGPDGSGHWVDPEAGIALGHQRLAIVDLSEAGSQPMISPSGRFVLAFNGEVYDHADLRAELQEAGKAPAWRGFSDTETLLAGIDAWGLRETLHRATGMFALALWDREARVLTFGRDRLGEKPFYYGWQGKTLLFGSELKALARHPAFEDRIERNVLPEFLRHGHVGEDRSIYQGIRKVRPGEIVTVSQENPEFRSEIVWSGASVTVQRGGGPFRGEPRHAVDALERLLLNSVARQMMADVPLGAFLSGGIDSSTVVALMQRLSDRPVHTFCIGFQEARYDEAWHARAVAAHLGTRHTDFYLQDRDLLDVVPKLPVMYDEPLADASQIPTYLVAKLAREHVAVALSGDGGDELFAGYDRYRQGARLLAGLGRLPRPVRRTAASGLRALPPGMIDAFMGSAPEGKENNSQRMRRLADYLQSDGVDDLHRKLVSHWRFPEAAVPGAVSSLALSPPRGDLSDMERMMQLDLVGYLPDGILTKVDRASMAVSLESRAPFLDHRVVEFAWSLPIDMKCRDGVSKWVLRQVLYRHVPRELVDRPKMGFEVPIGLWLRGPLRDWAEALLNPARLNEEGWLDPNVITKTWQDHLTGRANWGLQLWPVLMFQAWLEAGGALSREKDVPVPLQSPPPRAPDLCAASVAGSHG